MKYVPLGYDTEHIRIVRYMLPPLHKLSLPPTAASCGGSTSSLLFTLTFPSKVTFVFLRGLRGVIPGLRLTFIGVLGS